MLSYLSLSSFFIVFVSYFVGYTGFYIFYSSSSSLIASSISSNGFNFFFEPGETPLWELPTGWLYPNVGKSICGLTIDVGVGDKYGFLLI